MSTLIMTAQLNLMKFPNRLALTRFVMKQHKHHQHILTGTIVSFGNCFVTVECSFETLRHKYHELSTNYEYILCALGYRNPTKVARSNQQKHTFSTGNVGTFLLIAACHLSWVSVAQGTFVADDYRYSVFYEYVYILDVLLDHSGKLYAIRKWKMASNSALRILLNTDR